MAGHARKIVLRTSLVVGSVVVAFALLEVTLRLFFPRFQYAAEAPLDFDSLLIWSRQPNTSVERTHPDKNEQHTVYYNNLGLRQGRDITREDLDDETVISIFGDSYTENARMYGPFAFTETLDFLLNFDGKALEPRYTVLNYGVDGYATDQSYLRYSSLPKTLDAKHVYYVFCHNDIRGLYENNLVSLEADALQIDQGHALQRLRPEEPGWVTQIVSDLYTTYFIQELLSRPGETEQPRAGPTPEERKQAQRKRFHDSRADEVERLFMAARLDEISDYLAVFEAILNAWRSEVESRGGKFTIVLLPLWKSPLAPYLADRDFDVLDLRAEMTKVAPRFQWSMIRFENDGHWNEAGNLFAALILFNHLKATTGQPAEDFGALYGRLAHYYSCFDRTFVGIPPRVDPDPALRDRVRARYCALEQRK